MGKRDSSYIRVPRQPLDPQRLAEMYREYARTRDEDIRDRLVEYNLGLVYKIAGDFHTRYPNVGFADLAQEGSLGLLRALEGYAPDRGTQFSTYAVPWVNAYIRAFLRRNLIIPMSRSYQDLAIRIGSATQELTQRLARDPTDEEVAEKLGVPLEQVAEVKRLNHPQISLDMPADSDDDSSRSIGDQLEDFDQDTEGASFTDLEQERVHRALGKLSPKVQLVLRMAFGFPPFDRSFTFKEIGDKLGVSKQRAHQIYSGALAKLKLMLD